MEIADNGSGFNPAAVDGSSMGILSMRQRAFELGGTLALVPGVAGGMRVHLVVPLLGETE
jgi:signal transduction histidine kinase